jgi:peptidyl-prolyl cis-trans isomerase D
MIQSLRNNAAIIMWVVIVAFIATIVFAWGMDLSSRNRVRNVIGKVNGTEISLQAFERMVTAEREKERERYSGAEIPDAQSRMVPRQVWENEVSRILLREVFRKMKIGASTDEVYEFIKRNPPPEVVAAKQFQTDSVFDTAKFVAFLNNPQVYENQGMQEFEKSIRDFSVPMQTLRLLLSVEDFPTKAEVNYEYNMQNEKAVFEYAKVNVNAFQPDKPSDASIAAYYQAHQDSFATDEQVDLYYAKVPKIATTADVKATSDELVNLRGKIKVGDSSFSDEAKLESDDESTALQGGELGWVAKGSMVPEFDSVVFSIPLNQISMPVRTRFGYHIILVEQRETKDGKQMAQVRHILRKITPSGETIDKLNALADSVHGLIVSDGIKNVSKKIPSVLVDSTGLFKRGDMIPKIGTVAGAGSFAFNRAENEISDLLENDEGYFILQVKLKVKKGILPLDVARDYIVRALGDESRLAKAKKRLADFLQHAPDKNDLAHFSKYDSLIVSGVTDTVARLQYSPIGYNNKAVAAAFVLPIGKVSGVIDAAGSFCVVKPVWRKSASATVPAGSAEVIAIQRKLIGENAEKNFEDWYGHYKRSANVVDNVNQFYLD